MKWGTNAEKDKLRAEIKDKQNAGIVENGNSPIERKLLNLLIDRQADSESQRSEIEQIWSDEYKMVVGKQWDTTLAPRKAETKKIRPNSQDNFIFPTIYNMHSAITVTEPQSIIEYEEQDIADKLTDVVAAEREKNKFPALWKKGVLRWLEYGSFIWMVTWDQDWIGGKGPDRWVGEVRHSVVKKEEFFPDPAILDLEDRLQECTFINMRLRKKVDYLRDRFKDKAGHIYSDTETQDDEGMDPDQANLYVMWTRGVPEYVPDKWRKAFIEKAKEDEAEGDNYKAQEYKDKAEGILKGVHVAYATRDVILDYTPYIYDDGLYPFVFKTLYEDEESPWGIGEVRNIMMPQIAHNKADEIELEAMGKEGLGGAWYEKGAITSPQMDNIKRNSGKGGEYLEVSSLQGIKERTGPKVPQSITNYKEHKQRMIERITQDTPIQQGMKPGGVTAYSAIAELGSRADTKNKGKIEVLEDALTDITNLEISRISQFYTEPRYFKVKNQVAITAQPMQQQPVDMALPMQGMDMMGSHM
jgi:hypothetical protein